MENQLYQGNQVKVVKAEGAWLGKVGTVIDSHSNKYPYYPIEVYFGSLRVSEWFKPEQLEKL